MTQEKKVALVTGANRGIGREIVRQLAALGFEVGLGSRDVVKGSEAAAQLSRDGAMVSSVALDVASGDSITAAVNEMIERYGRIDILVNNAGVLLDGPGGFTSRLVNVTPEIAYKTWETNVLGPLLLTNAVIPHMRQRNYGRIVNVSSGAGQLADMGAGFPAYRISKAGLNALTRTTAAEVGDANIKINAMCPGWVKTDMGGADADRSVAEGADTAVWLATLANNGTNGGFFRDRRPITW